MQREKQKTLFETLQKKIVPLCKVERNTDNQISNLNFFQCMENLDFETVIYSLFKAVFKVCVFLICRNAKKRKRKRKRKK